MGVPQVSGGAIRGVQTAPGCAPAVLVSTSRLAAPANFSFRLRGRVFGMAFKPLYKAIKWCTFQHVRGGDGVSYTGHGGSSARSSPLPHQAIQVSLAVDEDALLENDPEAPRWQAADPSGWFSSEAISAALELLAERAWMRTDSPDLPKNVAGQAQVMFFLSKGHANPHSRLWGRPHRKGTSRCRRVRGPAKLKAKEDSRGVQTKRTVPPREGGRAKSL